MTNEIKEILNKLQKVANKENASRNALMEMENTDYQLLLDYITNLQEENERLKDLYRRTIEHLFKIGNDELARYFQAQINDCPSFVPQDIRGDE